MARELHIDERRVPVTVLRTPRGTEVLVGESRRRVDLQPVDGPEYRLVIDGHAQTIWLVRRGDETFLHVGGRQWAVRSFDPLEAEAAGGGGDTAEAPMPGTVVRVLVSAGDRVARGQTLVVLESMKMETQVAAWRDGVVLRVHHAVGATFDRKAPLVSLEPAEPPEKDRPMALTGREEV